MTGQPSRVSRALLAPGRTTPKNSFIIPPHDLTAELEDVEFHSIDGGLMELFRAEKIGEFERAMSRVRQEARVGSRGAHR